MDSQPKGGRFDGDYGVIAGLEAITAIHHSGITPRRPIEVVAWTNEEGGRFAPGCTGSMSWAGIHPPHHWDEVRDHNGIYYGAALADQLAAEADLPRRPLGSIPHAYVEAHIEQGPLLEAEGRDIGVVTGIQGSRWFVVTIEGESAHAGTAPLSLRRDAVQDAVRAIAALSDAMHDPDDILRFTIGRMSV
jgi:N-carbamoyl-L-amino-acid hydrolase